MERPTPNLDESSAATAGSLKPALVVPMWSTVLVAFVACLILATVPLCGGRLSALRNVELRARWLPVSALGAQVLIITVMPGALPGVHAPVHLATYALVALFLWCNRRLPGLWLVAVGAAANLAAIVANGGVMPASADALAAAGMPATLAGEYANSAVVQAPRLAFLGDVFAIPENWPFTNVFSVGDLLIAAGFAVSVHVLCASRCARAFARPARAA
jgi:hypothetical protein